jgi:hypothetical protein
MGEKGELNGSGNGRCISWAWVGRMMLPGAVALALTLALAALAWAGHSSERVTRQEERAAAVTHEVELLRAENREDHAEIKRAIEALRPARP